MATAILSRRAGRALCAALLVLSVGACAAAPPPAARATAFEQGLRALERRAGGRLGVAVLDLEDGSRLGHRAGERFAMASTFKLALVAAVLARVDAGTEDLTRRVDYGESDLQSYAPIARAHLAEGSLTIEALCDAALRYSDNTAANLLLGTVGGPAGLTAWLRAQGDAITRLDRDEPTLNSNLPGDPRDTTTPDAMVDTLRSVLLGPVLSAAMRARLLSWLLTNTTGDSKLRAGLDPSWTVGDKTGGGGRGASNDIAIVLRPDAAPVLVAVYASGSTRPAEALAADVAQVGRLVTEALGGQPRAPR